MCRLRGNSIIYVAKNNRPRRLSQLWRPGTPAPPTRTNDGVHNRQSHTPRSDSSRLRLDSSLSAHDLHQGRRTRLARHTDNYILYAHPMSCARQPTAHHHRITNYTTAALSGETKGTSGSPASFSPHALLGFPYAALLPRFFFNRLIVSTKHVTRDYLPSNANVYT
jgi:hypothetical protein